MTSNNMRQLQAQPPCIIAIMGCTGVGKSNFIQRAGAVSFDNDGYHPTIGHDLESCTSEPKLFIIPGSNIILIDTPGFNDTHVSDREMLRRISNVLKNLHEEKTDIAGILYLHPIDDTRITGSAKNNLDMFRKVVGAKNMNCCVMVTTKWSREEPAIANKRETDLKTNPHFWKPIFDSGVHYSRFMDTRDSALAILSPLCGGRLMVPQVISEWESGQPLHKTTAGRAVEDEVARAKEVAEADIKDVKEEAAQALRNKDFESAKALEREHKKLEAKLRAMEEERTKLHIEYEEKQRVQETEWNGQRQEYDRRLVAKSNRGHRAARRTIFGLLGAAAIVGTGGLAAPLVALGAIAHEADCQEEKANE